jgi:hypothetical protein
MPEIEDKVEQTILRHSTTSNDTFEKFSKAKNALLKLSWPRPETSSKKVTAFEVNIKSAKGDWVKSDSCKMENKTIYLAHKHEGK